MLDAMLKTRAGFTATLLVLAIMMNYADSGLANQPGSADDQQGSLQASDPGGESELTPRQRRQAERRRLRELEAAKQVLDAAQDDTDSGAPQPELVFVVAVEPEMECRRVTVVGSRVPKEICTPVANLDATERREEESAQDFLRRMRELSTLPQEQSDDLFRNRSVFE